MGLYINPPDCKKEAWLVRNGKIIDSFQASWFNDFKGNNLLVCLIFNYAFTAAGVCYSEEELEGFKPTQFDQRPRVWFSVPKKNLRTIIPELDKWIKN